MKRKGAPQLWHKKALMIDPKKTVLVLENADAKSENSLQLNLVESVKTGQMSGCTDMSRLCLAVPEIGSEPTQIDKAASFIEQSLVSVAIQDFQFSVTYFAEPKRQLHKEWFSFHWLEQAFSHLDSLLARTLVPK